jgi:hypothetical protein
MVYYVHSLRKYDTIEEQEEIQLMEKKFEAIYNPNNSHIKRLRGEAAMKECYRVIRHEQVDGLVFSTYKGHIGRGVYEEIYTAIRANKCVYYLHDGVIEPFTGKLQIVDVNDWSVRYSRPVVMGWKDGKIQNV